MHEHPTLRYDFFVPKCECRLSKKHFLIPVQTWYQSHQSTTLCNKWPVSCHFGVEFAYILHLCSVSAFVLCLRWVLWIEATSRLSMHVMSFRQVSVMSSCFPDIMNLYYFTSHIPDDAFVCNDKCDRGLHDPVPARRQHLPVPGSTPGCHLWCVQASERLLCDQYHTTGIRGLRCLWYTKNTESGVLILQYRAKVSVLIQLSVPWGSRKILWSNIFWLPVW